MDRQEAVEEACLAYPPISIFAEATTTNGTRIIPFKRGAFSAMRTVTPCFHSISLTCGSITPAYDSLDFVPLQVLLLASLNFNCSKITILPPFTPTPFMLEKHADKGSAEPWKIFAWCVRDVICKYSGLPPLDERLSLKDRTAY